MISLTPTGSPVETAAAYTLLAIIADPTAAQKRLDEIAAEKQNALDTIKAAQELAAEIEAKRAEVETNLATATKIRDETSTAFETRSKQLAEQEASITERTDHAAACEAAHAKREAALTERENDVKAREDAVFAREAAVKVLENDAQALKSDYEQKVAALQAALSK